MADKVVAAFLTEMARATDPHEKLAWAEKISVYSLTKTKRKNAGKPSGRKGISLKKNFKVNYGTAESDARIRAIGIKPAPVDKQADNLARFVSTIETKPEEKPNATDGFQSHKANTSTD